MKNMKMPGFTAEASLSSHGTGYRMEEVAMVKDSSAVIPQLSCWRVCYDASSTNHELSSCYSVCQRIKSIFLLA